LKWFWDNKRIGPTLIILNSQEALNITTKVAGSTGAGTGFRVGLTMGADQKTLTGGFYVSGYSKGAPSLGNQGCEQPVNSVNAEMRRLSQALTLTGERRCNDLKRATQFEVKVKSELTQIQGQNGTEMISSMGLN
jgi:hypothetical protein